jgi:hypothetical protein
VENAERKRLMGWIEEKKVLNGNKQGEKEGEWTYDEKGLNP